jgi:glycosyltransferase involved in cell wall biosynthesis
MVSLSTLTDDPAPGPTPLRRAICVLIVMETPWPTGGPAKNVLEFARRAASSSHPSLQALVTVAVFHRGAPNTSNDFVAACEQIGLKCHLLREGFRYDPRALATLRQIVASLQPDIIETHAVKSHFVVWLTRAFRRRGWVAFHHGYTWTSPVTRLYNLLDRWSLPSASHVVTDCRPFAAELETIGVAPNRITVQHSSVNEFVPPLPERVAALRRNLQIPDRAQVVLTVGRLSREKGQALVVEAAAFLRQKNVCNNLYFVLPGIGPDLDMLRNLAREREVFDSFRFPGLVSDIPTYYSLATLMALPSHSEGSPNVLLEAMAAGLPVVATNVGGVPEIVTHEREALLVESGNAAALAQAIDRLCADTALRERIATAARLKSRAYSPVAYCQSLLSVYARSLTL